MNKVYLLLLIFYLLTMVAQENIVHAPSPQMVVGQKIVEKKRKRLRAQAHQIEHFIALFEKLRIFFKNPLVEEKIEHSEFKNATEQLLQFLQDMLYLTRSKKVHLKTAASDAQALLSQITSVIQLTQEIDMSSLIEKKDIDVVMNRTLDIIQVMYLLYLKKTIRRIYEVEIESIKLVPVENPADAIIKRKSAVMLTHHKIKTGYNNPLVYISFDELWQQIMNEIYSSFDKEYKIGEIIILCTSDVDTRAQLDPIERSDYFIMPPNNKGFVALASLYPFLETSSTEK